MSLSHSLRRPAAAVALGAALLTTALSDVAGATTISDQSVLHPETKIPVDFAGYGEPSSDRIPSGYVIVKRTASMGEGEIHLDGRPITARLTAPKGYTLVAVGSKGRLDWRAAPSHYEGKRAVTLTLTAPSEDPGKQTATSTLYALAKRGDTDA